MRRKPPGSTTRGGWGNSHQRRRAELVPLVASGKAVCCCCGQQIEPGESWHLDHNDSRDGYLGVAHARCNLAAAGQASHRPDARRWSRRRYDDPEPGTVVHLGNGLVEIYQGAGEWQRAAF